MKIIRWINDHLEEAILIVILVFMTIIMGLQVCSRYLFNASMAWTEEVTRYLLVWSGFLSIAMCIEKAIAIRIDQLAEAFKPKKKAIIYTITYCIELVFFAYLIPFAWHYLIQTIESGQVSTACQMPMYLLQSAPLIGFVLCVIRLVQRIFKEIKKIRAKEVEECQ